MSIYSRMSHSRRLSGEGLYLYEVLELDKGANLAGIKNAYRKLSLKFHPDKNLGAENPQDAVDRMTELGKAKAILSDPKKREVYDRFGSKGILAGEKLDGMHRVNNFTMFLCNNFGVFSENI